eukprot:3673985-Pleurochrysis_carterae.AAC.5
MTFTKNLIASIAPCLQAIASPAFDEHALSLLEQLSRWEGPAAAKHADGVRDVGPGGHGNVKHAAHNAPIASIAVAGYVLAAVSRAAHGVVDKGG